MAKKAPKSVKKGKKKRKPKKASERWKKYSVSDDKITRSSKFCPRCGPGIFLSESQNRSFCGRCHYTEFQGKSESKEEKDIKEKKR